MDSATDIISAVANVSMAFLAGFTVWLAIKGFHNWKKEMVAKYDYDLALSILNERDEILRIMTYINQVGYADEFDKALSDTSSKLTLGLRIAGISWGAEYDNISIQIGDAMQPFYQGIQDLMKPQFAGDFPTKTIQLAGQCLADLEGPLKTLEEKVKPYIAHLRDKKAYSIFS